MEDLAPALVHGTAWRETIGAVVHSYRVREAGAMIDPMLPSEGLDAFAAAPPSRVLLTNRHHFRHADRFVTALGAAVHCHEAGLHELAGTDRAAGTLALAHGEPRAEGGRAELAAFASQGRPGSA